MKDEQVRCCDQWYQRRQTDQEDISNIVLRAYSIDKVIIDVEQSCISRVMFTVGRLVRVKKIVRTEVSSESRFNNTFNYFR